MSFRPANVLRGVFEVAFLVYIASFFFMLGADLPKPVYTRAYVGAGLVVFYLFLCRKDLVWKRCELVPALFFAGFIGYQLVHWFVGIGSEKSALNHMFLALWLVYLGCFAMAFFLFTSTRAVTHLQWVLAWSGFVLAMNAIPTFLVRGHAGYSMDDQWVGFLHPFFYANPTLSTYVFGRYAHPNIVGDVIALGFFPALGLLFYSLHALKTRRSGAVSSVRYTTLILSGLFAATTALAVIWLRSRGTLVCFLALFLFFQVVAVAKFSSRTQWIAVAVALSLITFFLIWAGDIQATWKEMQTLQNEVDTAKQGSSLENREGAKRALAIYRAHPFWGAGPEGYPALSRRFATPGTEHMELASLTPLCHYLKLLAEEGVGAYLYFCFILAYYVRIGLGLFHTRSRFQFLAGLSLSVAVSQILMHAFINHLMQNFAVSLPVYVLMGASLAVFRDCFDHGERAVHSHQTLDR